MKFDCERFLVSVVRNVTGKFNPFIILLENKCKSIFKSTLISISSTFHNNKCAKHNRCKVIDKQENELKNLWIEVKNGE